VGLRGNVDTRIGKARSGELAGVVLAAAGLLRLGRAQDITHAFSFQEMVPAIGQASLGLECRAGDARVLKLLEAVDDPETHDSVVLERDFMKRIGGGCKVPIAAHVYPYGEGLRILAVLGNPATGVLARVEQTLDEDEEDEMLEEVALRMEDACREKGIPLPHEVSDHALLSDGVFGASAFEDEVPAQGESAGRGA
jgi:porphobilinogen deaminase